jgi:hypothetical protein
MRAKQIDHLWKRTVYLADKRGGILFNDDVQASLDEQSCVLRAGKKKILFRFLFAITILILFYLAIKYLPKGDRWDELHGMFFFYGFFVFVALPAALLKFLRSSKCIVDNSNVVMSYWDFGRYRKLSIPINELTLKIYYNERPRRERKIPSEYCILSFIHNSNDPKEIIITSSKKLKEVKPIFGTLEKYFAKDRIRYFETESVDFKAFCNKEKTCPEFFDDLPYHAIPYEERESLKSREINHSFSHHSFIIKDEYTDHLLMVVVKWRMRAWLGYIIAVSICSLSAVFLVICLFKFGLYAGLSFLMLFFIVSLAPTIWGTNELLCRYASMDKSSDSLTYHPWPHSPWSRLICKLSDIKAVQLCLSYENVEKNGEYCPSPNYQLNLITTVDKPFKRLNLTIDNDNNRIQEQAGGIANFLEIPIYDHCD